MGIFSFKIIIQTSSFLTDLLFSFHCFLSSLVVVTVYFSNAGRGCLAESEGSVNIVNIVCVQVFTKSF